MSANQIDWDAGQEQGHMNPLVMVHRLLRGKYIWVCPLAIIFGLLGGVLGYMSQEPQYNSAGQIRIQPSLPKVLFTTEQSTATQMFSSFVNTQAELIKNPEVIQRALESDEWKAVSHFSDIKSVYDVRKALKVKTNRAAQQIITVSFNDEHPLVSSTLVGAVMDSYIMQFKNEGSIDIPEIRKMLENREANLIADRDNFDAQILAIAGRYRTENLEPLVLNALNTIHQLEAQREVLIDQKSRYEQRMKIDDDNSEPLTPEQAAEDDPMIAGYLARKMELEEAKDEMMVAEGLREGHRDVQRLTSMIANNQQRIDARLKELQSGEESLILVDDDGNPLPSIEIINSKIAKLDAMLESAKNKSKKLFEDSVDLRDYRAKRADKQASIAQVTQRLDQIDTESKVKDAEQITGKISIVGRPITPLEPTSDPRIKMAGVGFIGAGSLPVLVVLALAYFGHRIEYSDDDVLSGASNGIIGMLPDLGDSLADKELADASAFAVHQIRSQLQIKNHLGESRVYGVTSPAPQDGKTSMIIAIGLSFAESGDRTLLLDLDFIGRGLSVHFGYPNAPSLAESLESRDTIDSLIHETEFDGLYVLPAGFGDDERVSRLSPRSVDALISHLRTKFDTILIDSGPILASVEASFVAPQTDGMILVVGRGQYKPLVKKTIDYVHALEGNIVATVFNRALAQDLRQSSNSMSVHFSRQISRQQEAVDGRPSMRIGPVAGALFRAKDTPTNVPVSKGAES